MDLVHKMEVQEDKVVIHVNKINNNWEMHHVSQKMMEGLWKNSGQE